MTRCCVPVFVTERDGNSSRHSGAANPKKIADSVITVAAVRGTHTVGTCTKLLESTATDGRTIKLVEQLPGSGG